MKSQVITQETAERLKELGVKQESMFEWWKTDEGEWMFDFNAYFPPRDIEPERHISAFTAGELGEMLKKVGIDYWYSYPDWRLKLSEEKDCVARHENEAEARGLMLIHLLENKLITL